LALTHTVIELTPIFFFTEIEVVPWPDCIMPFVTVQVYELAPGTAAILAVPVPVTIFMFETVIVPGAAGLPYTVIDLKLLLHPFSALALTDITPLVNVDANVTEILVVVELPVAPDGKVQV